MSRRAFWVAQGLSAVRIPLAGVVWWCVVRDHHAWALASLLLCEASDVADGAVARRFNGRSGFGAVFDPYCDSVSRLLVYFGLSEVGLVPGWLVLLMACRDVSVAYVRLGMERRGLDPSARFSGKLKAVIQGAGSLLLVGLPVMGLGTVPWEPVVLWAVATVTGWSLLDYGSGLVRGRVSEEAA